MMKKTAKTGTEKDGRSGNEDVSSKLGKLFEEELRDIYWAEKALVRALGKMSKKATSEELIEALETHMTETEEHVRRLEEVFSVMGKEPRAKKCESMEGLIKEAEQVVADADEGMMRDAAIISAAQKVEHYEIASYGTLRTFAHTLGIHDAVEILDTTLEEEKNTDIQLTEIAVSMINQQAAEEPAE